MAKQNKEEIVVVSAGTEFERFRRSTNLKIVGLITFQCLVTLVALFLAAVGLTRPPAVIAFDSEGRSMVFRDTSTARDQLTEVRLKWFVGEFIKNHVGIDSASVIDDTVEALNMMTPRFRQLMGKNSKYFANRRKLQFPNGNLKTTFQDLDVLHAKIDPQKKDGQINVTATGKLNFDYRFPMLATEKNQQAKPASWFLLHMILQRTPVRENSIHGLMVDVCQVDYFSSKEDLDNKINFLTNQ